MKRLIFILIVALPLLFSLPAGADYATYFDVINDVKTILGTNPDEIWNMTPDDARTSAENMAGFTCNQDRDNLLCRKSHWTGEFEVTFAIVDGKLGAIQAIFTAPSIDYLNYGPNLSYIPVAEDLINRMKISGLISAAASEADGNLFEGSKTSAYGSVFTISDNTEVQAGYNSKESGFEKFSLAFLVRAKSADFIIPEATTETPESTEIEAAPETAGGEAEAAPETADGEADADNAVTFSASKYKALPNEEIDLFWKAPGAETIEIIRTSYDSPYSASESSQTYTDPESSTSFSESFACISHLYALAHYSDGSTAWSQPVDIVFADPVTGKAPVDVILTANKTEAAVGENIFIKAFAPDSESVTLALFTPYGYTPIVTGEDEFIGLDLFGDQQYDFEFRAYAQFSDGHTAQSLDLLVHFR